MKVPVLGPKRDIRRKVARSASLNGTALAILMFMSAQQHRAHNDRKDTMTLVWATSVFAAFVSLLIDLRLCAIIAQWVPHDDRQGGSLRARRAGGTGDWPGAPIPR